MNLFKYSFRFFKKFSAYLLLNIVGITIAILLTVSGVLFFTIQLNYDNFHSNQVYRVHLGKEPSAAKVFPALAERLETNISSITEATRLKKSTLTVQYHKRRISDVKTYYVDGNFFDVLNYEIILGNKEDLKNPSVAYISESLSKKLTNHIASIVGETLLIPKTNGFESYLIGGIFKDTPLNSHLKFNMLISYNSLEEGKATFQYGWAFKGVDTYIKTTKPIKLTSEESNQFLLEIKASVKNNSIKSDEALEFIPIKEVHYLKNMIPDEKYGDKTQNLALLILFIVLMLTLVFNFYGSSLIISHFRSKSLKLKKIFGASAYRILVEKVVENSLIATIATLIACGIFLLNQNFFVRTFNISRQVIFENTNAVLICLLIVGVIFVILPGFQAYFYSKSIDLKGKLTVTRNVKNPFSKVVMVQVTLSLVFVIVSLGVNEQVKHIEKKNALIETENIIVVDLPEVNDSNHEQFFKNEARKLSSVKNVALSNTVPFNDYSQLWWGVKFNGAENFENEYAVVDADPDFFEVYGIDLLKGSKEPNNNKILVNKKFVDNFLTEHEEFENIVGQQVVLRNDTFKIAGIVKDYYHMSSKSIILPSIYRNQKPDNAFVSIKFNRNVTPAEILKLKELWRTTYSDELFTYHVLMDGFEKIVMEDIQLVSIGSLLALSICILSLLALIVTISINLFKRKKEFTIRKIIGANKISNVKLVYKEYLIGIFIACIISMPTSSLILSNLLNNYIEKTEISVLVFFIPYVFFLLTTFVIVLFMYNYNQRHISLNEE